jgi:required for meiotic nuclear division protein 1
MLLGERLDTRELERTGSLGTAPTTVQLSDRGIAVLFRYGVAVLFNVSRPVEDEFLNRLAPLLTGQLLPPETDEVTLQIKPVTEDQIEASGVIVIRDATIGRLQAVAIVIAKSLILSHYETRLTSVFDRIEPLAANLRTTGRSGASGKHLMRHIGEVLLAQHKMIGRVEVDEKPELLWEHPELERLYARLADEYELRDRDRALDRKLDVISQTAETLLGLVQNRSSLRVEWYIVALIVAELLLSLYVSIPWH